MPASRASSGEVPPSVGDIVRRHFGRLPRRVERLGGGLTNEVFACAVGRERCVLRLNRDATKIQHFLKEQWAIGQAREHGVPAPEVLEVGNEPDGSAWMLLRHQVGVSPLGRAPDIALYRQLGALARKVHAVRTRGFGSVFEWSANQLSQRASWGAFLDDELHSAQRVELLERHGLLDARRRQDLASALAQMRGWRKRGVLHHGDLRLKNVLVDAASGRIAALLDWEHCLSAPAPYWDLSVALHDLGPDESDSLLEGYGLSPARFERIAKPLRALNLLNYAPVIDRAAREHDRVRLGWLKARLRGAFDIAA
jgi:aminoglycoside phosphotransferase (APT) family kinase protein